MQLSLIKWRVAGKIIKNGAKREETPLIFKWSSGYVSLNLVSYFVESNFGLLAKVYQWRKSFYEIFYLEHSSKNISKMFVLGIMWKKMIALGIMWKKMISNSSHRISMITIIYQNIMPLGLVGIGKQFATTAIRLQLPTVKWQKGDGSQEHWRIQRQVSGIHKKCRQYQLV